MSNPPQKMISVYQMGGFINTLEGNNLCAKYGLNSIEYKSAKSEWSRKNGGSYRMNEILNIQDTSEYPISGRELHERLGIGTEYAKWIDRMCEYGFERDKDFKVIVKNDENPMGGRPATDHMLTLSMAKELCMLQRTDQGREVRRYLIGVEEQWNQPDAVIARALRMANAKLEALTGKMLHLEAANSELTVQKQIMQPKADYFDELVDRNLLTNFRETAKQLHVKEKAFVSFLLEHKYIYRDKRGKLMPFAEKNNGLFDLKECVNEKTGWGGTQTLISPKGRETFRLLCQGIAE